jgi:hypothetical protein
MMIVLCDIDSSVANNDHRTPYIEPPCPRCGPLETNPNCPACHGTRIAKHSADWDAFYHPTMLAADSPIETARPGIQRLIELDRANKAALFFLTGRPERTRPSTLSWLTGHLWPDMPLTRSIDLSNEDGPTVLPRLLMRGDADRRHSVQYKEMQIVQFSGRGESLLFIDDDLRNKEMYSKYGLYLKAPECWSVLF